MHNWIDFRNNVHLLIHAVYKKHHPPMLEDEVWRLEKIGKDGAFHRKLAAEGINTVQDFLKVSTVEQSKLRTVSAFLPFTINYNEINLIENMYREC